jgi:ADP-L-glycero-D-manno-heptose 6-epimerase
MILITGAAGFIGSVMIWKLNERGVDSIIAVDRLHDGDKWKNLRKRRFYDWVHRDDLFSWLQREGKGVTAVIHLGACTDTTERDVDFFMGNNFEFSKNIWRFCVERDIPCLYASSAATYGSGERGYVDEEKTIPDLHPLNPYGWSKQLFDRWVLRQEQRPPFWYGFKFFNVYGPNEYHKGQMASIAFHAFGQAKNLGTIRLFKSYREDCEHGEQKRDFVYVKDVVDILDFFLQHHVESGIYNLGTGRARSFNDIATLIFRTIQAKEDITYFDMPESLRRQYQYFTEANIAKLKASGYDGPLHDLEGGISDYIISHLNTEDPYL